MTIAAPPAPPGEPSRAHDAFISYSRRDTAFAARLQQALEKYTAPRGLGRERRRLRVFRDQHDFTGTDYYAAIQKHLAGARKLIVVCSPDAATSPYVDDEIRRFVELHGAGDLVPVLWRGLPNNEVATDRQGEGAFPPALVRALEMPLAADFRGADPRSRRFADGAGEGAWMLLLANLLDIGRAELERRELRRRRTRRIWTAGVGAVISALLAISAWALLEGERALARQLAEEAALSGVLDSEQVEGRVLLARESLGRLARLGEPTLDAETALRERLAETPRRRLALPAGERAVAFSGDGNHLLEAEGGRLRVHWLGGPGPRIVQERALERPLRFLAAGPDHRFIAGLDEAGAVQVWSWPELDPITALPPELGAAPVDCFAFAHGGAAAVALRIDPPGSPGAELLHWRLGQGELMERATAAVPPAMRARAGESCLVVRRHSTTGEETVLASVDPRPIADDPSPSATILHWPLRRLDPIVRVASDAAPVRVWPDVLIGEADQNAAAVLLLPDGRVRRESEPPAAAVRAVPHGSSPQDLAAGGAWLATSRGLEDPYVRLKSTRFDIIDTSNGAVTRSVGDHGGWALFTPDATTLVTIAGARLRLWDRTDGRERLRLFASTPVERVLFDASSRQLAAIGADGSLEVFDIGEADEAMRAAVGPLLEPLASTGALAIASGRDLLLIDGNGGPARRLTVEGYPERMRSSPDGRWLALIATAEARPIQLADAPDAELLLVRVGAAPSQRWRGPGAQHLHFDRASRRLLTVDEDGMVRLLDLVSAAPLWERRLDPPRVPEYQGPNARRYAVALSDDGQAVAIGSVDGLVVLSGSDGRIVRRDTAAARALALSADGRLLARLAGDEAIIVQRTIDARTIARLERRPVAGIRELVFSPGGRRLMAIGGTRFSTFFGGALFLEEHLVVWDLETGRPELRLPESRLDTDDFQAVISSRADEPRQLRALVWNALSREVAGVLYPSMLAYFTVPSTTVRGRLTAWRLTDDGLVETYRGGERNALTTVGFAAGGGALLVRGEDGYARVIDLSGARLLRESCAAVRRGWTEPERRRHLGAGWRRPFRCERSP